MIRIYLLIFLITTLGFGAFYGSVVWYGGSTVERVFSGAGLCVNLVCFILTIVVYQDRKE